LKKPWQYKVTAVIPHCGTPDMLRLCVAFIRAQSIPIYIVVVDTGTPEHMLPELMSQRDFDLEIHQCNPHGTQFSSALVAMAMDFGQAAVQTEYMLTVHTDCFITDRELVEKWLAKQEPCIGYRSIPRRDCDFWRSMVSHTCTLWHMPTIDDLKATWGTRRFRHNNEGRWNPVEFAHRTDTEVSANQTLIDAGIEPKIFGEESWDKIEVDDHRVHLRGYTTAVKMALLPSRFNEEMKDHLARLVSLAESYGYYIPESSAKRLVSLEDISPDSQARPDTIAAASPEASEAAIENPEFADAASLLPIGDCDGPCFLFIAPFYQEFPTILTALQKQTHNNWRLLLYHDGPIDGRWAKQIAAVKDSRTAVVATEIRHNDWGHTLREMGINAIVKGDIECDWVVITNGHDDLVPTYCEEFAKAIAESPEAVGFYCNMLHNYWQYKQISTVLAHREIDCGAFVARRDAAVKFGFPWREHASDWRWIASIVNSYGAEKFVKVDKTLFIHN